MLDSICAPQVLVHLVHLSISACTGISTSQTNAQVRMQQAKRVHTHTGKNGISAHAHARSQETHPVVYGAPGTGPEVRSHGAKLDPCLRNHRTDHFRIQRVRLDLVACTQLLRTVSAKQHAYSTKWVCMRACVHLCTCSCALVSTSLGSCFFAPPAQRAHTFSSTALGRARGHRGQAGGDESHLTH